jgi:hypothetical protein
MGKLQITSSLFVVRWRTPAQEVPREGEHIFNLSMLKLLVGGRIKQHPANYRGCSHTWEELKKNKSQRAPKITTGKVFSPVLTTSGVSFAEALRGSADKQRHQACHVPTAGPPTTEKQSVSSPASEQKSDQSVRAPIVNSQPLDNMLRVVTVVQQIMTEWNCALSEDGKIVAITKTV